MEDIKVYRLNNYEWWAIKGNLENLINWYRENINNSETYEEIFKEAEECDLDNDGMWWFTENIEDVERLRDNDEIIGVEVIDGMHKRKTVFGNLMQRDGEVYKFIPYREAIKCDLDFTEPYCIASTEF